MTVLVELKNVAKSFKASDGTPRSVLEHVDFTLKEGEIVALLGQSGSGKSTLLRIMAGLISADGGDVRYRGQPLFGPAAGIAMVFQSFALFPWLTVQKNVELGLEARGVDAEERERRAEAAIELIGLSGFEGALPRELSGGMRQRVGLARALVTEPAVLLMDEAFSALDVLTGERLRNEILELWAGGEMPTKAMLVVSHNIEEAVMMADRVLIFSSNPGRVRSELSINLPRPRDPDSLEVRNLIDEVYSLMTAAPHAVAGTAEPAGPHLTERLPEADVGSMESLLELLLSDFDGHADLPKIADESELTDEELLPLSDALHRLGLAKLERGDLVITGLGQRYVEGEHEFRRQIFGQQLLAHVPLIAHIRHSLEQESSGQIKEEPFLQMLGESMDRTEAQRVLNVAIEWARYGEVFEYEFNTGLIHLPELDEI
ncbi:MAG: nitrate/sulfonate/bicarbonate ABC transporter ATP-binding protein [Paucibacter sp.]|nr:nitrate/sulfonate/bicarbonate ABC transporter ATP-binding protein [Roseateles sp.]